MKLFIVLIILAALLQSTFVPFNLCLILLITRSYVKDDPNNLILALITGILLGVLTSVNIGLISLLLILVVKGVHLCKKLPISSNNLTILPVSALFILIFSFFELVLLKESVNSWKIIVEIALCAPLFFLVRMWEERFVPRPGIKLKLR